MNVTNRTQTARVYRIAETTINTRPLDSMLRDIGEQNGEEGLKAVGSWNYDSDACEHSILTEVAGRLCYKSFGVGLNPNVTKVREGTKEYIANLLRQGHGSVLEHASVTYAVIGCSRIFTHELVRHRAGCAFSQESGRFVRLDKLDVYVPDLTTTFEEIADWRMGSTNGQFNNQNDRDLWITSKMDKFLTFAAEIEKEQSARLHELSQILCLNIDDLPFALKKKMTSAMRRWAPGGGRTNIIFTANHRALRHMIEARTALGAESEIAEIFGAIAEREKMAHPNIYQDMHVQHNTSTGLYSYLFMNSKI